MALPALKLILTPLLMGRASLGATLWTHGHRVDRIAAPDPARAALLAATKAIGTEWPGMPYVLYGTLGQLWDRRLRRRQRLVISCYATPGQAMEAMASLVVALAGR